MTNPSPDSYPKGPVESLATDIERDPNIQNRAWEQFAAEHLERALFIRARAKELFGDSFANRVLTIVAEDRLLEGKLNSTETATGLEIGQPANYHLLDPNTMSTDEQLRMLDAGPPQQGELAA